MIPNYPAVREHKQTSHRHIDKLETKYSCDHEIKLLPKEVSNFRIDFEKWGRL